MEAWAQAGAVLLVLGLLGSLVVWSRNRGWARFSLPSVRGGQRRMQTLERLALTPQHSLHLVSVSGKILLIAVSPGGCSVVEGKDWDVAPEGRRQDS